MRKKKAMIKISIEVRSSAARFMVALLAESIEGTLEMAKSYNPGKECKVVFPIDPQSFFVGDDLERCGVVGKALAYWHLRHAGILLLAMRRTGAPEPAEGDESVRLAKMIHGRSQIESDVLQQLSALRSELGDRVLRRNYPEGWGSAHKAVDE